MWIFDAKLWFDEESLFNFAYIWIVIEKMYPKYKP